MKKITFLMRPRWSYEATALLREAGALHLSCPLTPASEHIATIENKMKTLEKAIAILQKAGAGEGEGEGEGRKSFTIEEAQVLTGRIIDLDEAACEVARDLEKLESEYERVVRWGDFNHADIEALEKAGIDVTLFSCPQEALEKLPAGLNGHVINRIGGRCFVVVFSKGERPQIPFSKVEAPHRSFKEIGQLIDENKERLLAVNEALKGLAGALPLLMEILEAFRDKLEFEKVRRGMGEEDGIAYVKGFVPACRLEVLKKLASQERWGIVVEEPGEEDDVPTLIRHSRLSALFQPVMSFMGITPGYFEYDTNAVFLIFFSLFFAMIVGDAGYGLLLLVATFALQRFNASFSGHLQKLSYLLSLSTLVWGAVTGNWFGVSGAALPLLEGLIIPGLDSFHAAADSVVMELCFFIALLHLSVAHIWKALLSYPSLRVWGESGWVIMLTGIYFLVKGLILKSASLPMSMIFVLSGFAMIILFGMQGRGGFLKGTLKGLKSLPLTALDGVGGLSNIVSYLRLFAVGMASKEVAAAFNAMALERGFHDVISIFIAALILIFGHGVNMLLIAMSVIVHGIRLNILEYSGHMNIEWSGIPYKPFGRSPKEKEQELLSKALMEV
ncbi:MAG: hypothetical protein OEV42_05660 [Deltaproteobacteria bacterium]|nr:hypothetical protein [Deltaproteobacteria bacterium]